MSEFHACRPGDRMHVGYAVAKGESVDVDRSKAGVS